MLAYPRFVEFHSAFSKFEKSAFRCSYMSPGFNDTCSLCNSNNLRLKYSRLVRQLICITCAMPTYRKRPQIQFQIPVLIFYVKILQQFYESSHIYFAFHFKFKTDVIFYFYFVFFFFLIIYEHVSSILTFFISAVVFIVFCCISLLLNNFIAMYTLYSLHCC